MTNHDGRTSKAIDIDKRQNIDWEEFVQCILACACLGLQWSTSRHKIEIDIDISTRISRLGHVE